MLREILLSILFCISICCFGQWAPKKSNQYMIYKEYITIAYNYNYRVPDYVAEKLTVNMVKGNAKRESEFHTELDLPKNYRTTTYNYSNTGYDRGHLAPAADFNFSQKATYDSFSCANIAPQNPDLNRKYWKSMEDNVRKLTSKCDTLYIMTGTICNSNCQQITNHIYVPKYFWKAVVGKKGKKWVIGCAWLYINDNAKQSMKDTQMAIDELEKKLGYNLFYKICTNKEIESKIFL